MVIVFFIIACVFAAVMFCFSKSYRRARENAFGISTITKNSINNTALKKFFNKIRQFFAGLSIKKLLIISFLFVLVIKIGISFLAREHGDMYLFAIWARDSIEYGPWNFYEIVKGDYVPGYLYVLTLLGAIRYLFSISWNGELFIFLLKLPAIICDMVTGYVIYKISRRYFSQHFALAISLIYMLNPFVVTNSSFWGQMDSVFTLFMLLAVYKMIDRKVIQTCVYFTVALLIKFQAIFIAPVILIYFILVMIKDRDMRIKIPITVVLCVIAFYIITMPFTIIQIKSGDVLFPFKLYFKQIGTYNYYNLNTFNLYGLLPLNFLTIEIHNVLSIFITLIVIGIASFFVMYLYIKQRDKASLFLLSSLAIITICMLTFKMHERYYYPAFVLLLIAAVIYKDKRLFSIYTGFSILHFFNLALLLNEKNMTFPHGYSTLLFTGSLISLVLFGYLLYVTYTIVFKKTITPLHYVKRLNKAGESNIDFSKIDVEDNTIEGGER